MVLLGEQVLAQGVEGEELPGQDTGLDEAFRHQHDLDYQLKVWDDHGTGSGVGGGSTCSFYSF